MSEKLNYLTSLRKPRMHEHHLMWCNRSDLFLATVCLEQIRVIKAMRDLGTAQLLQINPSLHSLSSYIIYQKKMDNTSFTLWGSNFLFVKCLLKQDFFFCLQPNQNKSLRIYNKKIEIIWDLHLYLEQCYPLKKLLQSCVTNTNYTN